VPCWTVVLAVDNIPLSRTDDEIQTMRNIDGGWETVSHVKIYSLRL
jgi:hypothetical protein